MNNQSNLPDPQNQVPPQCPPQPYQSQPYQATPPVANMPPVYAAMDYCTIPRVAERIPYDPTDKLPDPNAPQLVCTGRPAFSTQLSQVISRDGVVITAAVLLIITLNVIVNSNISVQSFNFETGVLILARLVGFALVVLGGIFLLFKRRDRRKEDGALCAGNGEPGIIEMYLDRVEWITGYGRSVIYYRDADSLLECEDMLVLSEGTRRIVWQAMDMTPENLKTARLLLYRNIPQSRCQIRKLMVPRLRQAQSLPDVSLHDEVYLKIPNANEKKAARQEFRISNYLMLLLGACLYVAVILASNFRVFHNSTISFGVYLLGTCVVVAAFLIFSTLTGRKEPQVGEIQVTAKGLNLIYPQEARFIPAVYAKYQLAPSEWTLKLPDETLKIPITGEQYGRLCQIFFCSPPVA